MGAEDRANLAGRAYVFTDTTSGWRQSGDLSGSDTVAGDELGYSVATSGSMIVVGALGHADAAGRAYVFTHSRTGWRQAAELVGSDTIKGDRLGSSVAISGRTVIVGAPFHHGRYAGRVYVFEG